MLAALELLLMPALVLFATRYVVAMPPVWAKVAVIAAACPTGVNAYMIVAARCSAPARRSPLTSSPSPPG